MKYLLVLVMAFGSSGCVTSEYTRQQVVAESSGADCLVQPSGSTTWYACGSDEAKAADCLNLMETAMKALDPYLDAPLPRDIREKTLKVWERAKNNCWKELRDLQIQHSH